MAALKTIEEYEARQGEIKGRVAEIDAEFAGEALPDDVRDEWNTLNKEYDDNVVRIEELKARRARVEELSTREENREGAPFHVGRTQTESDIYDLAAVRTASRNHEEEARMLRDNALRAVERTTFPHERAEATKVRDHIARLLERKDNEDGRLARHLLTTGSPLYRRAFSRAIAGAPLSSDELRALSLTGAAGGFAVPFQLDPTIIPTSNFSVNPFRVISRVEQITTDEWRGVSSAGVTASYKAEAAEATDDAPSLAQPAVSTERADVFIPYSWEVGQDWRSLEDEMSVLIQDAKDDLEATKFAVGSGVGEPQGVITGATNTVAAGGVASFAVADLYKLEEAVPPRFRQRSVMVASRFIYNKVRQFDTAGGASLWMKLPEGLPNEPRGNTGAELIGYPANEASAMAATLATGSKILLMGDFRYFIIVERIGMSISNIPHLFGANRRPTAQSGLFAFWRNASKVLDANAFRVLVTG